MVCEHVHVVIDNNGVLQRSTQRSQVFNVSAVNKSALFTIQTMSEVLVARVKDFNHRVGVFLLKVLKSIHFLPQKL